MPPNLLRNASFEDGTYNLDPMGVVWIPKEWTFAYRDGDQNKLPNQQLPWGRPTAGCINRQQVPDHERAQLFMDGDNLWKVWSGSSYPFYITLGQSLSLKRGFRYRFTVHVFPDMVVSYDGGKQYATDPRAGAVRLQASGGGQTAQTDFFDGARVPNGRYTPLTLEFVAAAEAVTVSIEAYGLYYMANACFFFDNLKLEELGAGVTFTYPANNQLMNGSFEEGGTYPADAAGLAQVPNGWMLDITDAATPMQAGQTQPWKTPRAMLLLKARASANDQAQLFTLDDYVWQVRAENGPAWVRLWQIVSGLGGQAHRLTVHVRLSGPEAEANLSATTGGQKNQTGWQAGAGAAAYRLLELTVTPVNGRVEWALELRTRTGGPNTTFTVDLAGLAPV